MDKKEIYNLFINGMSITDISKIYNTTWSNIYQIIDGKLPNAKNFSVE